MTPLDWWICLILVSSLALLVGFFLGQMAAISDFKRDHGPDGFFHWNEMLARGEYQRGLRTAADFIRQFNSCTTHDYDLGDCLLSKFNQLDTKKIRKNSRRLRVSSSFTELPKKRRKS